MQNSTTLLPAEAQGLLDALDDEYKAWATYDQVIRDFGVQRPFSNIVEAEQRHIDALLDLCARYGVTPVANRWPGRVPRYDSIHAACVQSVQGEIDNAALYDRLLQSTQREDILAVYRALQSASTDRHLRAFQRCAAGG
ncbi:DUF2202 domain-containing protein [Thiomonas sp. FB-Cd]|uniref:ferritin-like domain-containing protein n=1 Tax=Thiomonas sp. FB-Cd TaxID=1158292 RepID=UPI000691FC16|nr:DUF2202 domain-containing protein [Thiomonas sp. FB-Cd]